MQASTTGSNSKGESDDEKNDNSTRESRSDDSPSHEELPLPNNKRFSDRVAKLKPARESTEDSVSAELDASDFDIPVGWFGVGIKSDVPKEAYYIGRYRDRYAWVMPGEVGNLAKFTLAVLTITKLESGQAEGKSGLMFTP